jgi:hypothetical protein
VAIVLCPGIHPPQLTDAFWTAIQRRYAQLYVESLLPVFIVPKANPWGVSPLHVVTFLEQTFPISEPLLLIGFSAGVVGGIAAALAWQMKGGVIKGFVALDGWGVPLSGPFAIYRLSHDEFTHWSSQPLGLGKDPFYADPRVEHLALWQCPDQVKGWQVQSRGLQPTTAADVLCRIINASSNASSR